MDLGSGIKFKKLLYSASVYYMEIIINEVFCLYLYVYYKTVCFFLLLMCLITSQSRHDWSKLFWGHFGNFLNKWSLIFIIKRKNMLHHSKEKLFITNTSHFSSPNKTFGTSRNFSSVGQEYDYKLPEVFDKWFREITLAWSQFSAWSLFRGDLQWWYHLPAGKLRFKFYIKSCQTCATRNLITFCRDDDDITQSSAFAYQSGWLKKTL